MSKRLELEGKWVLVTGASSGLGREIAVALARDYRAHVLAVARRADRLESLAAEIRDTHGRECRAIVADLSSAEGAERVFADATTGRDVSAVVLNAGVTFSGFAIDQSHVDFERMLATNVSSQVALSRRFALYFRELAAPGGILIVSSLTAMTPTPFQAAYAGTKAFLTTYGRGLAHEVKRHGVSVTVFMPGGIATEMLDVSGMGKWKKGDIGIMDADVAAQIALAGFVRRRELVVPGLVNQLSAVALKIAPHSLVIRVMAKIYADGKRPEA